MTRFVALFLAALALAAPAQASQPDGALRASLQRDLDRYSSARSQAEHITAISLSVSLPGRADNINVTTGCASNQLWQIGSNTKAFTSAAILQLEAAGALSIDQTVGHWLPQYPAWKRVTVRRLLNMTSGIPDYAVTPAMLRAYARNPQRSFTIPELIAYVYPGNPHAPPATTGYGYSNTNYVLAELIIERAAHHTYANELEQRFFRPLKLSSTYYTDTQYPPAVLDRMVPGYFFNREPVAAPLAPLLGKDVSRDNPSWLKASGGIVATLEDLTHWARALYTSPMLAPKQRAELLTLVSTKTGKPIQRTSATEPAGFGLGIMQATPPQLGTVWIYQGATFGYRVVHVYFPRQDVAIAIGLNSQPDSEQNHINDVVIAVAKTLHEAGRL